MNNTPSIVQSQALFESLRDNELISYLRTTNEAAETAKHRLDAVREAKHRSVDEAAALNTQLNDLGVNCRRIERVLRGRGYSDEQIKAARRNH